MSNLLPGQMLGPYQIINQTGKGGMATVYKAYHAAMDRYIAIKVLPHEFMHDETFLGRFQQEARLIAKLEHSRILPVYDYGESEGVPYLVMRYMDSGTLKDRIQTGRLSLEEIDRFFTQLAEGLGYAHQRGVIHRDIKPTNAMLNEHGELFLTDFGIAKLVEGSKEFTSTGAMTGTPAYMSPEQAQGQKVDLRTDIYSLGIVLYEMVTGQVPFDAETPMAVIFKKVQEPLPPPSQFVPDIHPSIEAVLLKALAKQPQERYSSIQDFLSAWKQAFAEAIKLEAEKTLSLQRNMPAPPSGPAVEKITTEMNSLPQDLTQAVNSSFAGVRSGAVQELELLLAGSNPSLAKKAYEALLHLSQDDSKRVSAAAATSLAKFETLRLEILAAEIPGGRPAPQTPHSPTLTAELEKAHPLPLVEKHREKPQPQTNRSSKPKWLISALGLGGLILVGVVVVVAILAGQTMFGSTNPTATPKALVANHPVEATPLELHPTAVQLISPPSEVQPGLPECADPDIFCIGLVASGSINDKGYNQSAWETLKQAERELGSKIEFLEAPPDQYEQIINEFTAKKFDMIVTTGFSIKPATEQAAEKFPDIFFAGVDQTPDMVRPNYTGLMFHEDQAGYLAGVLAAYLTQKNIIAGIYGSSQVPAVVRFEQGYAAGARSIKPEIQVIATYYPLQNIEMAFADPTWGKMAADLALHQGADVVFAAAGETGIGVLTQTATRPGVYCIGVDSDQWETIPDARSCLVSSAMKMIQPGLFDLIVMAKENRFPGGNFVGPVGLAPFHDFENKIPEEIKLHLNDISNRLRSGELHTGVESPY